MPGLYLPNSKEFEVKKHELMISRFLSNSPIWAILSGDRVVTDFFQALILNFFQRLCFFFKRLQSTFSDISAGYKRERVREKTDNERERPFRESLVSPS